MFPIIVSFCQELARINHITQRWFSERFARLLLCTSFSLEEDGPDYIALHIAEWTSEGENSSEDCFTRRCISCALEDK